MKKTILLTAIPLILVVFGCGKESTNANQNCTDFTSVLSSGKEFRYSLWVYKKNGVEIDRKYFYATDTNNFISFKYLGNNKCSVHERTSIYKNGSFFDRTLDTSYQLNCQVNQTEKTVVIYTTDPSFYLMRIATDSFNCMMLRNREVETSGSSIKEYFKYYTVD